MSDDSVERPLGAGLLAMLSLLVALLGSFAILSLLLTIVQDSGTEGLVLRSVAMVLLASGFYLLAVGLWRVRPWARLSCHANYLLLVAASLLSTTGSGVVELGAVLVLGLALLVNVAVMIYLRFPASRSVFSSSNDDR